MPINNIAIVLVNTSIRYDTNIYIYIYTFVNLLKQKITIKNIRIRELSAFRSHDVH